MLFFYIIMYLMRWCALYLLGAELACLVMGMVSVFDVLIILLVIGVMWLIGKGIDFMLGHPQPPKFLDTKTKMAIAVAASLLMGFASMFSMAGA